MCKTLINRAKTICEVSNIDNELEHLRNVLKFNGYPRQFIDKAMKMPQRVQQKTEYQSSIGLSTICWPGFTQDREDFERSRCSSIPFQSKQIV